MWLSLLFFLKAFWSLPRPPFLFYIAMSNTHSISIFKSNSVLITDEMRTSRARQAERKLCWRHQFSSSHKRMHPKQKQGNQTARSKPQAGYATTHDTKNPNILSTIQGIILLLQTHYASKTHNDSPERDKNGTFSPGDTTDALRLH